ncbi:MAG: hypothetical protein SOT25_02780 [Malacoplasma sp.]|nr:hypothetical protein [Malacoplasma sp.]
MPRFYVENKEHKWNIFSSIVDDFLYDDFVDFKVLKGLVIKEAVDKLVEERNKDLDSLLTEQPLVNTMFYEDAMERIKLREDEDLESKGE